MGPVGFEPTTGGSPRVSTPADHHRSADPSVITPLEPAALPGYATTPSVTLIDNLNITVAFEISV